MTATECGHGHIYDSDIYASCPYCNSAQPVIQFDSAPAGQGGWAAYDQGKTQPIQGGFGPSAGFGAGTPTEFGPGGFGAGPTQGGFSQSAADPGRTAPLSGGFGPSGGFGGPSAGTVCDNNVTQPPRGYRQERRADEEQKTVGDLKEKLGLEPVVGWLVCIEGPEKGKDYRLWGRINTIGRGEKNDVCLKGDLSVSKENHARLGYDPKNNRFRLIPASSSNNIYLNGDVVDVPTPLHAFDLIEFGSTKLTFVPLCCESFSWEDGIRGKDGA